MSDLLTEYHRLLNNCRLAYQDYRYTDDAIEMQRLRMSPIELAYAQGERTRKWEAFAEARSAYARYIQENWIALLKSCNQKEEAHEPIP